MTTILWHGKQLAIKPLWYANPRNICIHLLLGFEPYAVATVNTKQLLPSGCVLIKNWSENQALDRALLEDGLIKPLDPPIWIPCGFCDAQVYQWLGEMPI
ncbi:hypothetical protein [Nodosilinea nodulosa]|uniref:hypothetical protein n=1 Tax=Nodosilinea nodulosa TaxID=416001 RepID=UPI00036EA5A6|nr:hypothetical protein [Nodosilinea nodulosa]